MERKPFLITHPKEVGRLFLTGCIESPDGRKWNISFCPGVTGSWSGFKSCWTFSWEALKWGWSPKGHGNVLKFAWDAAGAVGEFSLDLIKSIPEGVSEGSDNISKLYDDTPFGWIPRIGKNIVWNCFLAPILKFITGAIGAIIGTPLTFIAFSLVGCLGKWVIGNGGSLLSALASFFPLIGGTIASGVVALGSMVNRFPKDSDHGTYGLYLVENH